MSQPIWTKILLAGMIFIIVGMSIYSPGFPLWVGVVISLISAIVLTFKQGFNRNHLPFLSVLFAFFAMEFFWIPIAADRHVAILNMGMKTSIIVLPFCLLGSNNKLSRNNIVLLLNVFFIAMLLSSSYLLSRAIYSSIGTDHWSIYYSDLSIWMHPGYYSLLICGAIMIGLFTRGPDLYVQQWLGKWARVLTVIFFILIVFLLSARMQLIVLMAILFFSAILAIIKKRDSRKYYFILFIAVVVGAGMLLRSNYRMNHLYYEITHLSDDEDRHLSSGEIRVVLWSMGWDAFLESPLLGHGTSTGKQVIMQKAEQSGQLQVIDSGLGVHNEYLDALITKGIGGLVLLLSFLFLALRTGIRTQNHLLVGIVTLFVFTLFTESAFEREIAVIMFGILVPLAMLYQLKIKVEE